MKSIDVAPRQQMSHYQSVKKEKTLVNKTQVRMWKGQN